MDSIPEDIYISEMKHKIEFMEKRLNYLNILKDEQISKYNSFVLNIYNEYNYIPKLVYSTQPENKNISNHSQLGSDKLYRKLSLVCHPDKINNDDDDCAFVRLQQYNKNNDLYHLLCMANEYKIDTSDIDMPNIYMVLEKKLYELNRDIENIIKSEYYPFIIGDGVGMENLRKSLVTNIEYNKILQKENDALREKVSANEKYNSIYK